MVEAQTVIRLAGFVFLLLGATFVGLGFWVSDMVVVLAGGLAAVPGVVLLGLAAADAPVRDGKTR